MALHKDATLDNVHALVARTYADIAARDADTAFNTDSTNLNKKVRVDSPAQYFMLFSTAPLWIETSSTGSENFTALLDTPSSYSGQAGFVLQVNVGETDVEFGQALRTTDSPQFTGLTLTGDLTVLGTTTTIDSTTLLVEDKNIELGNVATPTDVTADGGGITLLGTTNKTIAWDNATGEWKFNQGIDIAGNLTLTGDLTAVGNTTLGALSIGGATPAVSASLDLKDTDKAFLHNRLTTAQRDALTAVAGMQIYNTTLSIVQHFDGTSWSVSNGADVVGPPSSVINAISVFADTSGNIIKEASISAVGTVLEPIGDPSLTIGKLTTAGLAWTSESSSINNNWFGVTFGNDLFVAVAASGTETRVMTSPDGEVWTTRTSDLDEDWVAVTFGNNLFVAVASAGTSNQVQTSPDGINWELRNGFGQAWQAITFGNGLYVAVANSGAKRVMTSPDGINWTLRNTPGGLNWRGITFGNGLFVAVSNTGSGQRVMTSSDGITWTLRTTPVDNAWLCVAFGDGLFVAASFDGSLNRVMTSPDGITWTIRVTPNNNNWICLEFGDGLFVACAASGSGDRVMTSPDGIVWTARTSAADNSWQSIAFGNRRFVTVSSDGSGNRAMLSEGSNNLVKGGLNVENGLAIEDITVARKPANVVEVFVASDMPNIFDTNTKYVINAPIIFADGQEKTILAGAKVEIVSTSKFVNTITYSGTGTFLSGALVSEVLIEDINLIGNKSAKLFDVTGIGGSTFNLVLTDVRGWADVGTLKTMGIGIVFQSSIILDNDDGIKVVDCGLFRIHRTAILNFVDSGNNLITIDALTNRVGMSTSTVIPQGSEKAILIDSGFTGQASLNLVVAVPEGLMFDPAGLDQTSKFVNAQQNQNLEDSTTSAELSLIGNSTVTSIPAQSAMVEIARTPAWTSVDVEQLTPDDSGCVQLDSITSVKLKIDGNINLEPTTASKSLSVRVVLITPPPITVTFTNGTNLINETATSLVDGDLISFRDTVGTLPAEIRKDVIYHVVSKLTNSFQISYTNGGSAITFTDDGTPTNSYKVAKLHGSIPTNTISNGSARDLIPQATLPATTGSKACLVVINNDDSVDIKVNSGYQRYFV